MFKQERNYIGVMMTEETLKVSVLKVSSSQKRVTQVIKRDIKDVEQDGLITELTSVMKEINVKNARTFCEIPLSMITTKNIEIPSLDPEEIKSIIDLQAGRHTPYSREEIIVGYITIGIFQRNYTKVLLLIVNRSAVLDQLNVLEASGIKVENVYFAPESIAKFYAEVLEVQEEDPPIAIIDIGSFQTYFIVGFNRTVATCRLIPVGMHHLINEKDAQEKFVSELLNSLEAYQSEDINQLPEKYILTSDDTKVKELKPLLEEKIKGRLEILSYLERIDGPQPVMMRLASEYNEESFLDVISGGLYAEELQVDLTPDEIKVQRSIEEKGRELIKAGVFSIVLLFLVIGIFFATLYSKSESLAALDKIYAQKHRQVMALDWIAQKTRIIKDYASTRMTELDIIDEMYHLIPEDIYLEKIDINEDGTINISGISQSMSRVFNFVTALEESGLFKGVKTNSTSEKQDRGQKVATFDITFRLESAKDPKETEAPKEATGQGTEQGAKQGTEQG